MLSGGAWLLGRKYGGDNCYVGLGEVLLPTALAARVAVVSAYASARGTLGADNRSGQEKKEKTKLDISLKPLEICEIKGRS